MKNMNFEFDRLVGLLGRSENDPEVKNFFGRQMSNIERNEYYGFLEFKADGIAVVFQEAPWVLPAEKIVNPKELILTAFHFYRDGHEGYLGYSGDFPQGILMGDSEAEALRKMGQPSGRGGGSGVMPVLNRPIPRWFQYALGGAFLSFQLDATGHIEMATLFIPETDVILVN